jgi:hypothetical protein
MGKARPIRNDYVKMIKNFDKNLSTQSVTYP